jgi:hypothetical protein
MDLMKWRTGANGDLYLPLLSKLNPLILSTTCTAIQLDNQTFTNFNRRTRFPASKTDLNVVRARRNFDGQYTQLLLHATHATTIT